MRHHELPRLRARRSRRALSSAVRAGVPASDASRVRTQPSARSDSSSPIELKANATIDEA